MRISLTAILLASAAPLAAQTVPAPAPAPATPQDPPASADEGAALEEFGEDIVVTGQRPRGSVVGDIAPEVTLDPRDIRAYGASDLGELLEALAPLTNSISGRDGGQPVTLVNGRRISGFREIRDLPPEAVVRVEILPEEVALKYGYSANQRVVNFVLRPRFRAITAELRGGSPTDGGSADGRAGINYLSINRAGRLNIDIKVDARSALTEAERDLLPNLSGQPFDLTGNIVAADGTSEIDAGLSALAGAPLAVAGVPTSATGVRVLGDFTGGANVTDLSPFRTLQGASQGVRGNAVLARTIFGDVAATATLGFDATDTRSLLGLPSVDLALGANNPFSPFANDVRVLRYADASGPLTRDARSRNVEAAFSMNGTADAWRWTLTGNYDRSQTDTDTDRRADATALQAAVTAGGNPFAAIAPGQIALAAPDTARSVSNVARLEGVANGNLLSLPAGDLSSTFRMGVRSQDQDSRSFRAGLFQQGDVGRRSVNGQASIDVPIASRRSGVLDAIGDLSLNANVEVDRLSDFGTLTGYGTGVNWSPIREVRLLASFSREEGAPSPQQVGNPAIATPNVRVFDFVRGETVDVTVLDGGSPFLRSDSREVVKLGLNIRPLEGTDLNLRADYTRSTIDDPIASFPTATAEIQAAFPDRFARDASGRLLQIDSRPVNFQRSESEQLRWGFNLSLPVQGTLQRRAAAVREAGGDPRQVMREAFGRGERRRPPGDGAVEATLRQAGEGGRRGGGRGGGGRFGGGGAGGGRIQFSAFHTYRIGEAILIRDGVPELNLLEGSATGSRGGLSRHEVQVRTGYTKDGFGARINADWQSGTRVDGTAPGDTLSFGELATFDLRLFANLGQMPSLVREHRWLRGTRVSLIVDNAFNQRLDVRDASGVVPLGYQAALLDPLGRTVRFEVRKLF